MIALALAAECWIEADESSASMWASHFNIFPEVFDGQDVAGKSKTIVNFYARLISVGTMCSYVPGSLVFWQADPTKPRFESARLITITRATNTAVVQHNGVNETTSLDRLRVRVDEPLRRKFLRQIVASGSNNSRIMLETDLIESVLFWTKTTTVSQLNKYL